MRCLWRATALRRCRSSKRAARAKPGYQLRLTIRRTGPARTGRRPTWSRRRAWRRSAPCLDRINEPLLAQGRDGAPGRRPRDLVRLNKLTLGRDAGVRRVLPGQDPALDDRRSQRPHGPRSPQIRPRVPCQGLLSRPRDAVLEPPGSPPVQAVASSSLLMSKFSATSTRGSAVGSWSTVGAIRNAIGSPACGMRWSRPVAEVPGPSIASAPRT